MIQVLFYCLFLIAGAVTVFLFFKLRLKKVSDDLNTGIDKLKLAFIPDKNLPTVNNSVSAGLFDNFTSIGNKMESIAALKNEAPVMAGESNELNGKTESLQKKFDNLRVVNELGQFVTSSLKLEDTFQHLYHTINSIMDAAVFELGIYTWRDNRWQILSNIEIKNSQVSVYKNHIAEWSLQNNREVILGDAVNDFERYVFKPLTLSDGKIPQSIISFPVLRHDKEVGAITVMSFSKNAFNEYHIEMIRSLIPYTAVAIANAVIHQELINTQTQLIHNEKMASLGQIASGIAHEILNPINFVNNFSLLSKELIPEIDSSHTVEEQTELKNELTNNLDKIHFHGQRAYSIVKNMMLLSRTGKGEKTTINVNKSVDDFLEIAVNGFKNKVAGFDCEIEKLPEPKLPDIEIVAEDFGSVLLNVFNNAFYTMNEKRKKINTLNSTSTIINYQPNLKVKTSLGNGFISISVSDNGLGIPEEILGKIFLPFFTTKPTGEGTGLGLSISHDIITKGNRGEITVQSEVGKGSEFKILLPVKLLN